MKKSVRIFSILFSFLAGGSFAFSQTTTFNYVAPGGGVSNYYYTGGMQNYTVPAGVTSITIETWGAQGGGSTSYGYTGGLGARMKGTFAVTPGQVLKILVGGVGSDGAFAGGGGGGAFVTDNSNNPLCIAGGGSGASGVYSLYGNPGLTTTAGGNSSCCVGGSAGAGGGANAGSGGGGGLTGNGTSSCVGGGLSFTNGGTAGAGCSSGGAGGYGGGSGGEWCCQGSPGAGGGYSGGAGSNAGGIGAGGGGSYNGGTSQSNSSGVQSGNGQVTITAVGSSIQTYTVPAGVTSLTIESYGAQGGNATWYVNTGGLGARMKGTFAVTPGQVLKILVGGAGVGGGYAGGGGGGSFVTDNSNNPLCIAGGGSGANGPSGLYGNPGLITTSGGNSSCCTGGSAGGGGGASAGSHGGGGLTGNGTATGCSSSAGLSFTNGGAGGIGSGNGAAGGYGGGSGGEWVCQGAPGAGGGYSGGAGSNAGGVGAGAGGSYNGGTNQSNSSGVRAGNGVVYITLPSPYQSAWISMSTGSATWCAGEVRTVSVTVQNIGTSTWTDAGADINIGCTWSSSPTYPWRVNAGNLAPGSSATYNFTVTAPGASTDYLVFDVVKEGDCWFGGNAGSCGPGNVTYSTAIQTISCCTPSTPVSALGTTTGQTTANLSWAAGATPGSPTVTYNWYVATTPSSCPVSGSANFSYTAGMQTWIVPAGVTSINVTARGAQGGNGGPSSGSGAGASGAVITSTNIAVTPGHTLNIMVGGQGVAGGSYGGGGGGGTFIWNATTSTLLTVAGGGGGYGYSANPVPADGQTNTGSLTSTNNNAGAAAGGTGGNGGAGGNNGSWTGGGGAGWSSNGSIGNGASGAGSGGFAPGNGGSGGPGGATYGAAGGYGGGGGGNVSGGGGGGYNGGGGGGNSAYSGGSGGGSYAISGTPTTGLNSGNGSASISYNSAPVVAASGATTSTSAAATGLACNTTYYLSVYATTSCNGSSSACATSAAFTTSGSAATAGLTSVSAAGYTPTTVTNPNDYIKVCPGTVVTTTRTGGTGTAYYWGGDNTNALEDWDLFVMQAYGNSFNYTFNNPGLYFIRLHPSDACGMNYGSWSDVTVEVSPVNANSIGASQTICSGTSPAAFTGGAPSFGALGTFGYQWQQSTDNGVTWANAAGTSTNSNYSSPALTQNTIFKRNVSSNSCATTSGDFVTWAWTTGAAIGTGLPNAANNNRVWVGNGSIKKTNTGWGGVDGWGVNAAAAISTQSITANGGYVEAIMEDTDRYRMLGLGNYDVTADYTSIEYAIYPTAAGTIEVYESGVNKGSFGAYAIGDKVKVSLENNQIKYYKNATLLYTSAAAPTLPLFADVSIYTQGSGFKFVKILNPASVVVNALPAITTQPVNTTICAGSTSALSVAASGFAPLTYQWQSMATNCATPTNVGSNSPNYTTAALSAGTYYYRCVVTNSCGTSTSNCATVTVDAAPVQGTVSNAGPIDFCSAGGDWSADAISVSGSTGTIWWQYGFSNGTWSGDWVTGTQPGYVVFPKKVAVTDGTADRVRWYVKSTNGGCAATGYSAAVLLRNHYNEAPTSLTASSNPICSGTGITLTANFPTATCILGNVQFYSGSCGGTLIATVAGNGTTSVATGSITPPLGTTNYYARYNPGTGTGCSATGCTPVLAVTANAAPTASNAGGPQTICTSGTVTLAANNPTVGVGAWTVTSGPSTSSAQFSNVLLRNAVFTPAGGVGSYVLTWTITNAPCTASSSNVTITVNAPPTIANAGAAQSICSSGTATMAANNPTVGTGAWTVASGPSTLSTQFNSTTAFNAVFTPAGGAGSYVLTWTISSSPCSPSASNVTITVSTSPVQGGVSNAGPIDFCSAAGDWSADVISIAGSTGTVWWQWGSSNGTWSGDWVSGINSGTCCFPKKVAASDGNPDRVRWYVKNGGCPPTAYSAPILLRNHYNENPTSIASSINNICSGTPGTLTVTFPTATNILGTVEFATTCAGTPFATVAGNGTTTVATAFTAPAGTTTYYARYNPGTGTGCAPGSCVNTTVTVLPPTPATPGVISGVVSQCQNLTGQIYSIVAVANATSYNWVVPTGWSVTSGGSTNVITVTTGGLGQNGNITVTATNSCGTSAAATLPVIVTTCVPPPSQLVFPTTTNSYVTLSSGAVLVMGNPATNAIVNSGTSGGFKRWIISEGQGNAVQWNNITAGTYVVPFGYSNTDYIPFTFTKTSAGASNLNVSTWGTGNDNTPWATATNVGAVTNMWSSTINSNGSIPSVIDRWWDIRTAATADITFSYRAAESLTTTFPTAAFRAQHWNGTIWEAPVGTGTVVASGIGTVTVPNASSFSPWVLSADGAPLPVTWLDVSAECNSGDVTIKWSTASEQNSDYFTVERSVDGTNFSDLATVLAAGNSSTVKKYSSIDEDPYSGTSFYRVRETDFNGSFMHSDMLIVNQCSSDDVSIFGNGNGVVVGINADEDGEYAIEIYDVLGQLLMHETKVVSSGTNHFKLSPGNIASAIYVVKVYTNSNSVTKKVFIRKQE